MLLIRLIHQCKYAIQDFIHQYNPIICIIRILNTNTVVAYSIHMVVASLDSAAIVAVGLLVLAINGRWESFSRQSGFTPPDTELLF